MNFRISKGTFLSLTIIVFSGQKIIAQDSKIVLNQDLRFERLLNEKRKINASIVNEQRYNIQIFNGESEIAKRTLASFKNNYKNLFEPALAIWKNNFNQDNILARGHNPRFVLNVKYKSIQFHSIENRVPWSNFKRARALYL